MLSQFPTKTFPNHYTAVTVCNCLLEIYIIDKFLEFCMHGEKYQFWFVNLLFAELSISPAPVGLWCFHKPKLICIIDCFQSTPKHT